MFPPTQQKPKRVGGASFTARARARRGPPEKSLSARTSSNSKATASGDQPSSARNPRASREEEATRRAELYYRQLLGRPGQDGEVHQEATKADARQDWTLVEEIDALDHFNREEQNKRAAREKNVNYRADLQEQLAAKHNMVEKCREVWKDWRTELEDDVVQFQQEEESKRVFKLETQKRFNQERQRQLDDIHRRKVTRKEEEKKIEQEMMEVSEQAKARQDEVDSNKKNAHKQAMLLMKGQADVAATRKKVEREQEQKRDIKMQQEYEEMLASQERRRDQYFRDIRDKQSSMQAAYEAGVGDKIAKLAEADDQRARKHQAAKEDAAKREAEAREQWRRDLAESGHAAVKQQLNLQAQERERRRQEDVLYLEKQRKEDELAAAKEADKVQKKKDSVLANAEYIRRQIQEKEARSPSRRVAQSQMNEIERRINKEKLERACDPNRPDGLQSLLGKKKAEYRPHQPVSIPS